jgi:hypothetical protein
MEVDHGGRDAGNVMWKAVVVGRSKEQFEAARGWAMLVSGVMDWLELLSHPVCR